MRAPAWNLRVAALAVALPVGTPLADAETRPGGLAGSHPAFPANLYWGDLHVHSSWSADAASYGNRMLGPDQAYRFARGEEIVAHNGRRVRLRRPLDFLMVTDHAEYLGLYPLLEEADPDLLAMPTGRLWHRLFTEGRFHRIGYLVARDMETPAASTRSRPFTRTMWDRVIANAERHNDPGRFTTFVGYEWSSMPDGANLHRNVLFRDGADKVRRVLPFSAMDGTDPEDLWRHLDDYETRTGGRAIAIPHNGNVSAGRMFERRRFRGQPLTAAYAEARAR